MRARIENLRQRRLLASTWVIAVTIALCLSVSGVVTPPALALRHSRALHAHMLDRARSCAAERESAQRVDGVDGAERLRSAALALERALPSDLSVLAVRGVVQLLARKHGVELERLEFGATEATEFPSSTDRVVMRVVEISGRGRLSSWSSLVDDVRRAGNPCQLLEVSLARETPDDELFDVALSLGLHHTEPTPSDSTEMMEEGP